jgi:hypothetical protein
MCTATQDLIDATNHDSKVPSAQIIHAWQADAQTFHDTMVPLAEQIAGVDVGTSGLAERLPNDANELLADAVKVDSWSDLGQSTDDFIHAIKALSNAALLFQIAHC